MIWSRPHQQWQSLPRVVRYLFVGLTNTTVGYGIFALCYLQLKNALPYWLVLAVTHLLAVTYSFLTQRFLVFTDSSDRLMLKFLLFHLSYLWLAPQGIAINWSLVHYLDLSPWIAQGVAMLVGIVTAFLLHKQIIFRATK